MRRQHDAVKVGEVRVVGLFGQSRALHNAVGGKKLEEPRGYLTLGTQEGAPEVHIGAYAPLVKQFSAYQPLPGLSVNVRATEVENIADLAGLAAAFDAYRATLGARATDRDYVRRQDREFFIGFARSWRSRMSDSALRVQLASDIHAPDRYRIATVRNMDAWYDAFDVQPGQQLYLAPEARVRIW